MEKEKRVYSLLICPLIHVLSALMLKTYIILFHTMLRANSLTWDGKKVEVLKGSVIYLKNSQGEKNICQKNLQLA